MIRKEYLIIFFGTYRDKFPDEQDSIKLFSDYLVRTAQSELFTRKNFDGHITTSAFIVDPLYKELLLLKHKSLGRWLQPGGHVETDNSLLQSALREAVEETGIPGAQLEPVSIFDNSDIPFDIDSHYIPVNAKKQEDGHYHHDLRYLFVYTGNGKINYNEDESTGLKWVGFSDLESDATFGLIIKKIRKNIKRANS